MRGGQEKSVGNGERKGWEGRVESNPGYTGDETRPDEMR